MVKILFLVVVKTFGNTRAQQDVPRLWINKNLKKG